MWRWHTGAGIGDARINSRLRRLQVASNVNEVTATTIDNRRRRSPAFFRAHTTVARRVSVKYRRVVDDHIDFEFW